MKYKLLLTVLSLLTVACNTPATVRVIPKEGPTIDIKSSGRMGGRGGVIAKTPDVTVAVYDNNDASFKELNKTVRTGIVVAGAAGAASSMADSATSTANAETAAKLSETQAVEATKQVQIIENAAVEKAKIAAEAAVQ